MITSMHRTIDIRRRRHTASRRRSGAVIVEFAICVPILFLFFFAALEFSRVNMIRQTIENAAYEGSRRGIVPGATADDCRNAAQLVLNTVATNNAQITVTPSVITPDTSQVTVAISVPVDSNSWVTPFFFKNKTLSNSMTMRRERFSANSVP
jgi:Flp pilus assembly protein TadG